MAWRPRAREFAAIAAMLVAVIGIGAAWLAVPWSSLVMAFFMIVMDPPSGPRPDDRQMIATAQRNRAALDDLVRINGERRIAMVDLVRREYLPYCTGRCPYEPPIPFDPAAPSWQRVVRDMRALGAITVSFHHDVDVTVWEAGGILDTPIRGYTWADRAPPGCIVTSEADGCDWAFRPIGHHWYLFRH